MPKKSKNYNFFEGSMTDAGFSNLKGKFRYDWTESSFLFDKKRGKQIPLPASNNYIGSSLSLLRVKLFLGLFITIFGVLLGRVGYLQVVQGAEYTSLAQNNRQRTIPIPSERGLLFDRNGIQLTKNIPKFSLALVPQDLPRDKGARQEIVERLAELTNQKKEIIQGILEEYGNYSYESIIIQENLDYDSALRIQIAAGDLPGIHIHRGSRRLYLHDVTITSSTVTLASSTLGGYNIEIPVEHTSLSHVLGYQAKLDPDELSEVRDLGYLPSDSIGKSGIEKSYESDLRGSYGKQIIEVDALGKNQGLLSELAPTPGDHVWLSIDAIMQEKLEDILRRHLYKLQKEKAVAIATDPDTGEILAMVSLPSFDNNDFSGGIKTEQYKAYSSDQRNPLFNRAIAGTFPSGSTIKPAIAAGALQEGIITANTSFLSAGGIRIGEWFFPDWKAGGHGNVDVRESLAWSVNTFYYMIGGGYENFTGLGVARISDYLHQFGFADVLGIDIPGERPGFLPTKEWKEEVKGERWYVGDTYNLSIGQGDILVTPLQIAMMTSVIANNGTLYKPILVSQIVDPLTNEQNKKTVTEIRDGFIDPFNLSVIRRGMKDCVEYGSCRSLYGLPVSVAGKTGTAQWRSDRDYHAWFTSFAPYENPEIVLTVLVEEGGEGSEVAVPIAKDFYTWWSQYRLGL